nr:MAG TPA: replisome organizer [Caudoviricetes sp.]
MAEVKWIKITTNVFDNRKIRVIETLPDGYAIIVVWFKLLCLAGTTNDGGGIYITKNIPYTEQTLAAQLNMPLATVQLALTTFEKFEMIERVDDFLQITNWERYQNVDRLSEIREYNRLAKQKSRAKQKLLTDNNVNDKSMTSQRSHDTDKDKDKDINIDNNNILCKSTPKKADIDDVFERLWRLYPNKKGKAQVSDSKKKAIYSIGYDEMSRAIKRYTDDLKKDSWRKAQNGSTFFNSGYVDYLDSNYIPAEDERTVENGTDKQDYRYDNIGTVL